MSVSCSCSTCAHCGCCETPCGGVRWVSDAEGDEDGRDERDTSWDDYDESDRMDQWCNDHPGYSDRW